MNRKRASSLAVVLFFAVVGCIKLPGIDPGEEPLPDLGVSLRTPAETTYTNGAVDVSVEVTNGTAEAVELFAGEELLATLTAPYTFRWDTSPKPEGVYTLTAKARRGAQAFTSGARAVVVDRTPPRVLSRTPEPGTRGVQARHQIHAVISEALDPGAEISSSVRLRANGTNVSANVTLSADGRTLIVEPVAKVLVPAELEVVLAEIRDLAGNGLRSPPDEWSWNVPDFYVIAQRLGEDGNVAGSPSLQLDASGRPVVAYRATGNLYVRRWNGSAWEPLGGSVNTKGASNTSSQSALELDSTGRPIVAWSEVRAGISSVYVSRWLGNRWEPIGGPLSTVPGVTHAGTPLLQLDAAGYPVVAFHESDGTATNAHVWRWNGEDWEPMGGALNARPGNTPVKGTSFGLDPAGSPVVAWREAGDHSIDDAYVARWSNGEWKMLGGPISINPGFTSVEDLSLAIDPSGDPIIGTVEMDGSPGIALYIQRWDGEQWAPAAATLKGAMGLILDPSLQINALGQPMVAWTDGNPSNVYIKQWTGTEWQSLGGPLNAMPDPYSSVNSPALQINAEGYPAVAWSEALHVDGGVYVAYFNY